MEGGLAAPLRSSASMRFGAGAAFFWLLVGLLAGTQEFLTIRSSSWSSHLAAPLLASGIWIGLTVGAAALSRHFPLVPLRASYLLLHGVASVSAGFILNLVFFLIVGVPSGELLSTVSRVAVRWLHLNAGAYWGVVAVAHWLDGRLERGGFQAPARESEITETSGVTEPTEPSDGVIRVRTGRKIEIIRLAQIVWIEGAGDYARIHVAGRAHLASRRLKELEAELPSDAFLRVHRSALVRVDRIQELQRGPYGDYEAVMDTGDSVRISRRRRKALMDRLEAATV